MLIHALCDYYDILAKAGQVLPEGYSCVKIHYLVSLTEDGKIDDIIEYKEKNIIKTVKGKSKETWDPKIEQMPQRTEKSGIDANIIEHRPLYLFGLNYVDGQLSPEDRTNKAKKSHEAFVKVNLDFTEGMDSLVVQAYRKFILNWNPEEEIQNSFLVNKGKEYGSAGYIFCLSGYPDQPLHQDPEVKSKWEEYFQTKLENMEEKCIISQCAVSGKEALIARIHSKIRGVYGGLSTGSVLVGFNNSSESSYGKDQSYNSNISEKMMKKYTEALNYLLTKKEHRMLLDNITVVFWAMDEGKCCEDQIMAMLYGKSDQMDAEQTEKMLKDLLEDSRKGKIIKERLQSDNKIKSDVDFYMLGLKPNSSRLAVKFIYRKKYADVLWNIARFQADMQLSKEPHPISFGRIMKEMISPKISSKNQGDKIDPALLAKIFKSVIYGTFYPEALLEIMVRRVKTDTDLKVNEVRAGVIKACINRNNQKEEMSVALNKENKSPAYLCGRLFAVLERLQQEASGESLNRTIKDAYFGSAASKPASVFPRLMILAQNHLDKVRRLSQNNFGKTRGVAYYNIRIGEIVDLLEDRFPDTLGLSEQGSFIIGYYQQTQDFFTKKENTQGKEEKKDGNSEQV